MKRTLFLFIFLVSIFILQGQSIGANDIDNPNSISFKITNPEKIMHEEITDDINTSETGSKVSDIEGGYTVAITEINYHSDNFNSPKTWVELHNYGGSNMDISNWKLRDATAFNIFTIPPGTVLNPDEYLVLVQSIDTFLMIHETVTNYIGEYNFGFPNAGGIVRLQDNFGATVKQVNYFDTIPWPKGADGLGPVMQILDETGNENDPANWIASCVLGTPGQAYVPCDYDIIISEINYNSAAAFNPGDWVEILNRGTNIENLSGWSLRDGRNGNVFLLPNGLILDPGERVVVSDSLSSFMDKFPSVSNVIGETTFSFSNGGDAVRLYTPSGEIKYSVRYNDKSPWPEDADGLGFTLESIDEGGNPNLATSWTAGCLYGSPGTPFIIPCPTSVYDQHPEIFTVSPNPFDQFVMITLNENIHLKEIYISNMLGQKIRTLEVNGNFIPWDGKNNAGTIVSSGIYLITAIDERGNVSSMRIVKN